MKFTIITLFPDFFDCLKSYSVIGRAIRNKAIEVQTIDLHDFGLGSYSQVDDKPFGGGVGMLIRVDVAVEAIKIAKIHAAKNHKVILLSPSKTRFNQEIAENFCALDELIIFCAHYEGVDERVKNYVDEVISLGDFVLSGAETAAISIIDATARLNKGVLGKDESSLDESFSSLCGRNCLEYPQYTRPAEYEGQKVPQILMSGNHAEIEKWKKSKIKKL